ncbi:hypothetical protein C8A00DRAFT_13435 [Chaetomidium leptoderma]|uniref:Uncharacterized protein n=1 Tax=Chaetomidium leptoderma TaxID=669021 RepID=A0AAN7A091_9PEZI|nr:hypothetical protein C8A00DRAFT_13435 [Chaetomidium leptoderma]
MSADALPITPTLFAAALKDLPISTLHLKVLELRNSIAHLDYSNEQLRPFAEGTATAAAPLPNNNNNNTSSTQQQQGQQQQQQPDADCIDAIKENEQVIERMQARIRLVRQEVEGRGLAWTEFQSEAEREAEERETTTTTTATTTTDGQATGVNGAAAAAAAGDGEVVNGTAERQRHSAWTDGTFQMGVIRDGVVQMDRSRQGQQQQQQQQQQGGSLTDEELRRRMEEQLRGLGGDAGEEDDDDEGGLHL